ncbi:hypothetical protein ACIQU2_09340 [Pseudomonas sp. NPDC098740]|uniref:hypothetical protein n=1 Tax=Pseudomonas sp. NPDC098740 TaxID=3364486 RepID=UPI00383A8A27
MPYVSLPPEQSKLALLQLPPEIDRPANVWFDKLLAAGNYLAARALRDDCHAFTAALEQRREVTRGEADIMRAAFDQQWFKRIDALADLEYLQAVGGGQ